MLYLPDRAAALSLPAASPALHLIQQIRDEAHRFAITGHRQQRARRRNASPLESIPGVGAKRRQQLLQQFGGLREVARAGVEDLSRVKGINRTLAQQIYDAFHGER
jgi:excinuclease ABC subunit C